MKYFTFLYLAVVMTSSKSNQRHSGVKRSQLINGNETLSDLDFEDSVNSYECSKKNFTSRNNSINTLIKTVKANSDLKNIKSQPKKHRNAIKMVCDSDSLISEMTLHMNFLDSSPKQKKNYITLHKAFHPKARKHISFSFPERPERLYDDKSNETEFNEHEGKLGGNQVLGTVELVVKKPSNGNVALKQDNNDNSILLDNEYDSQLQFLPRKLQKPNKFSNEKKYKAEIKKLNGGPGIELFKIKKEDHPLKIYQKTDIENYNQQEKVMPEGIIGDLVPYQKNNKLKAQQNEYFSKASIISQALAKTSSPRLKELNLYDYDHYKYNDDINIDHDINNDLQAQNNVLDMKKNSFHDNVYDEEKVNEEEILNNSTEFKKNELKNARYHVINQHHKLSSLKLPLLTIPLYNNLIEGNIKSRIKFDKDIDRYQNDGKSTDRKWKLNLVARPKLKSFSNYSSKMHDAASYTTMGINDRKMKKNHRQKVIQNLKFILSKEDSSGKYTKPEIIHNLLPKQEIMEESSKEALIELDFSDIQDKRNDNIKFDEATDNDAEEFVEKNNDDIELRSNISEFDYSSTKDSILYDIYDFGIKVTRKFQVEPKDLLKGQIANENDTHNKENFGKPNFQNSVHLKFENSYSQENNDYKNYLSNYENHTFEIDPLKKIKKYLNDREDIDNKLSKLHNDLEKYTDDKIMEDKGEEIRKGVFLKKGIPLQFNPNKNNGIHELKEFSSIRPISNDELFWENENLKESINVKKRKPQTTDILKSKKQKRFHPISDDTKINNKRLAVENKNYLKSYNRFLRDIDLFKFFDDENSNDSAVVE